MGIRERLAWGVAAALGLLVIASIASTVLGGPLDPPAPPGSTMKTLADIPGSWSRTLSSSGADACNTPRFTCVLGNEAVLDNETGLVWQRTISDLSESWATARNRCLDVAAGGRYGWRLAAPEELKTLMSESTGDRLPAGHPFLNVPFGQVTTFWTATTSPVNSTFAYVFSTATIGGGTAQLAKTENHRYWCVRGGVGYDGA